MNVVQMLGKVMKESEQYRQTKESCPLLVGKWLLQH